MIVKINSGLINIHLNMSFKMIPKKKYQYLFTVEEVNKLVLSGVPFRDAYKQVGLDIEQNKYLPDYKIHHTHEGSLGNLCLDEIKAKMESVLYTFDFDSVHEHINELVKTD